MFDFRIVFNIICIDAQLLLIFDFPSHIQIHRTIFKHNIHWNISLNFIDCLQVIILNNRIIHRISFRWIDETIQNNSESRFVIRIEICADFHRIGSVGWRDVGILCEN
ncbi:hypothetical protein D3C72_1612480 [compost metagenome]